MIIKMQRFATRFQQNPDGLFSFSSQTFLPTIGNKIRLRLIIAAIGPSRTKNILKFLDTLD